jgi:hypothetical protein
MKYRTTIQIIMKTSLRLLCALCALASCSNPVQAASDATSQSRVQLAIELRDGSRVVGKTLEDTLSFHSAALGDMKLAWAGIRSIEFAGTNTSLARLTATNGDGFAVTLAAETLRVETGFGQTEMPVRLIRSVKVSPPAGANAVGGSETARLAIELRDGSHVVGKGLDDTLNFHSSGMGDLKLTWAGIRSIEYAGTNIAVARLTAANGDVYEVQFATPSVRVETSFGKSELPVVLIRSVKVSIAGQPGQMPAGLVALWSGEGNGDDSIGGNTATLTDITFAEGKVGRAFSFNGLSSCIKIPASKTVDLGADEGFTIMAWIKPLDVDGMHPLFEWTDYNGLNLEFNARPSDSGGLWASITDHTGNRFCNTHTGLLATGVFQHIACTYDKASSTATWYLNGVIVAQRQLSGNVAGTKGDLIISRRNTRQGDWSSNRSYSGLMDEIAIYNRALTASEVLDICIGQNHGEPLVAPAASTGWFEPWMQ